jgi:hypothetical protein
MSTPYRAFPLLAVLVLAAAPSVNAQAARSEAGSVAEIRDNRFKWFFGAQAGAMLFETPSQTQTGVPAFGAHLAVVSRRAGLMIGVDEGFGSGETSGFIDSNSGGIARSMTFDRLRRYQFSMTGYPSAARWSLISPSFGLLQVVNAQFDADEDSRPLRKGVQCGRRTRKIGNRLHVLLAGVSSGVGRWRRSGSITSTSPVPGTSSVARALLMGGLRFSWKLQGKCAGRGY